MRRDLHLTITGDVVGVFFRASAQEQAQELGLTGWAGNANGGVEILAQGEEDKLKELLEWCKVGPKWARVTSVDVQWGEVKDEFNDFKIR